MKKTILVLLALLFFVPFAQADWEVTVSGWTMSGGPDLAHEQVLLDDSSQCQNILPADNKSCVFSIPLKTGQKIVVRSFDSSGDFADNELTVLSGPNPSTGGGVTAIWK